MSELLQTKNVEQLKQEMGPLKASQILRQAKCEQYRGGLSDGKGKFCARGVILTHFGWDGDITKFSETYWPAREQEDNLLDTGQDHNLLRRIARWNDGDEMSFNQIADKLEEMGY